MRHYAIKHCVIHRESVLDTSSLLCEIWHQYNIDTFTCLDNTCNTLAEFAKISVFHHLSQPVCMKCQFLPETCKIPSGVAPHGCEPLK